MNNFVVVSLKKSLTSKYYFMRSFKILILAALFFSSFSAFAAGDPDAGKASFVNNCATCHNKNMKDKLTGPALGGVRERWGDDKALYSWIRNNATLRATGYPRAVQIYTEYGGSNMTVFSAFKDADIDNLLSYIEGVAKGTYGTPKNAVVGAKLAGGTEGEDKDNNALLYIIGFALLTTLVVVLSKVTINLSKAAAEKNGEIYTDRTWTDFLTSKGVIGFVIFSLIVLGGYTTVNNAIALGRQQTYSPDQPIKFSHKTHSGLNKIDCQYCHDGARRSKHGLIPATNTCMNCHKAIKVGSQYKTAELTKIYASSGWDPSTDKYIDNYNNMSEDEVAAIFKKWISSKYREERKLDTTIKVSNDERNFVDAQWNDIASSLKSPYKDKVQGPIEWKRIHNLPDHVYFNHAQHVAVGKVACQTCHGPAETMVVMKQYAPLSMGWCINCHRETSVKFEENDYYKSYTKYHEEIKKGTRDKVTVEDIGGLECQKCHY